MAMDSPHELFMHEMGDIYNAEQMIAQILPVLTQESQDPQAQQAYQSHLQETQHHIHNLEQCFKLLGNQPPTVTCYAVSGLKQEHDHFKQEGPSEAVLTMFDLGAAAKTEHYEIASYSGLVEKANLMGLQQCAQLLQENLQQEQAMLQRVTGLARQLGQQAAHNMNKRNA